MTWHDMKTLLAIMLLTLVIVGVPTLAILQPYFEAKAFNKFTSGPKATYWDALWSDLRVTPK